MSIIKQSITDTIQENRPKLSASSKKTYVSTLSSLYRRLSGLADRYDNKFFKDHKDAIIESLSGKPAPSRKSVLSALFILTNDDEYRKLMLEDCKETNEKYRDQTKSQKETENWMSVEDIEKIYRGLFDKVSAMFSRSIVGDPRVIMEFLLVGLLGGVSGLPPRRSLDYAVMKIRNYSTSDNYYKAGKFYFNIYKTAKRFGTQVLEVPSELDKMIKKWIKLNKSDYLLYSSNENHLSSPQITRILNKVFGKKVSTDMLRHIFLTERYKNVPSIRDMEELATQMGHSTATALEYVKK